MPTHLPIKTTESAWTRHLVSLAICLAMALLVETSIRTPPLAGEAFYGGYGVTTRAPV